MKEQDEDDINFWKGFHQGIMIAQHILTEINDMSKVSEEIEKVKKKSERILIGNALNDLDEVVEGWFGQ